MIDSVTIQIKNFVLYSDEFFTKAQIKELSGEFGVFGRFTTRYTDYPKRCAKDGRYFPQVHLVERMRRWHGGWYPMPASPRRAGVTPQAHIRHEYFRYG